MGHQIKVNVVVFGKVKFLVVLKDSAIILAFQAFQGKTYRPRVSLLKKKNVTCSG